MSTKETTSLKETVMEVWQRAAGELSSGAGQEVGPKQEQEKTVAELPKGWQGGRDPAYASPTVQPVIEKGFAATVG